MNKTIRLNRQYACYPCFKRKFTRSLLLLVVILYLAAVTFANEGEIYFPRTPAISPNGEKVVFSYNEDLWIVPAKGGIAYRLTAMPGEELYPRFSPDGQWLAFSGSSLGNLDVYVMPVNGGTIRRLTFHSSDDNVDSWSWDSQYIYFNSSRYNDFTEFKVSIAEGTPVRIFENYFNMIHGMVEHPQNGSLYFTDSWESYRFANRKRYKGDFNPDIKSYNPVTKEYKIHTNYRGKDFAPAIDKNGNLYFLSDRDNDEFNLFTFKNEEIVRLTDFPTSIAASCVSADGSAVVFEKDYQLFIYHVKTGETAKIKIDLFEHNNLAAYQDFNVKEKITYFDISPDSKKIAFVSRGELFVSDIKGKFIRQVSGPGEERIMEVKWLKDNRTLLFNRTAAGWLNLFKTGADEKETPVQLTFDKANNRNISLNSDRSQAVYLSGRDYLKLLDLKTFKSQVIVQDEFWGTYGCQPYFSPDDRYVLFAAYRNFERDLFVHRLDTAETVNLTDSGLTETDPCWSPDGKYIFFTADRYDPDYPRGGNKNKIYRLALEKYDEKYRLLEFEKLFQEEVKDKTKEKEDAIAKDKKNDKAKEKETVAKKPIITFDYEEMVKRWEQISPNGGGQYRPFVIGKDDEYTVLYLSDHDGDKVNIWKTTIKPFEANKTEKINGAQVEDLIISQAGDKDYTLIGGVINEIDLAKNSLEPIRMDFTFRRSLAGEFSQMFYEIWANLDENYYDETFHGVDWEKIRQRYERFLPFIQSRADLRRLISDLLGELSSSHLGFNSDGKEEETYYKSQSLATGIIFENNQPYRVSYILKGSAADKKGIDIKSGDLLTAVNDRQVDMKQNREFYFIAPSLDKEMKLTFTRENRSFSVYIHPQDNRFFKRQLYDEWIQDNQNYVDKATNNRVAYIHMKNMGDSELKNFIVEMTNEAYKKEALILDLRYNTGGNVHDAVLNFLSRKPYTQWKYRGGKFAPQPNFAPSAKPMALLVNEQSLSDAEMTTAGFKELKLGKVIGTETYRWLIFTSGDNLVDDSYYRLPSWGCYTLDGKDIEWHGVAPDEYVVTSFKDRLEGKDPQLDRAIQEIMPQLKKE